MNCHNMIRNVLSKVAINYFPLADGESVTACLHSDTVIVCWVEAFLHLITLIMLSLL